ncbi:hypothetical protein E2562_004018 [Oryza meyeriana var. granulata]|uniref:Uncharacterized protein n=1 Tax=Oryza meyeriana var. granulata TaxID=110450 RepID=A0A6G1BHI7_9ORYZ|nr:hypothetical protein E2562_004018 [Oryza meyeriana var. granulata]
METYSFLASASFPTYGKHKALIPIVLGTVAATAWERVAEDLASYLWQQLPNLCTYPKFLTLVMERTGGSGINQNAVGCGGH